MTVKAIGVKSHWFISFRWMIVVVKLGHDR